MTTKDPSYWLLKSEADCYSIDDWKRDKETQWTGVRNYQARNFMKSMKKGDGILFYHSGDERAIVGIGRVSGVATPDLTALDKKDDHFDPKASKEESIWYGVHVKYEKTLVNPVSLVEIKRNPEFEGIVLAQRGSRLSIQPVSGRHFEKVVKLGSGVKGNKTA